MAKTVEQLAEEIYKEMLADGEEVTKAEALEMAQMEMKAKGVKNYVQSEPIKAKAKKEVKLDDVKVDLIQQIAHQLDRVVIGNTDLSDIAIANPQKEITFTLNGDSYSISLIKHRPPKK